MKYPGGGYAPSYNAQVSTDAKAKIVVGVHLSQDGNDIDQLTAAVEDVKQAMGREPEQVVADGGYGSRANIVAMAEKGIDFISSLASEQQRAEAVLKGQGVSKEFFPEAFQWDSENGCFVCPAGKQLTFQRHHTRQAGHRFAFYRAKQEDCQACINRIQCCPQVSGGRQVKRVVSDQPAITAFREKMEQPETKEIYKKRTPVSETVNA